MQLNPIENRSLAEQAAFKIEKMIIDNKMNPGDRLLNEMDFVSQLEVGRGTIREAIKLLESRNVVEIHRGKGTFVSSHVGMVGDPLGFRFAHDKKKLAEDLSELRCMLEPRIASLCAERASQQDIMELQELCSEVEAMIKKGEDYSRRDIDFHVKLAGLTGNTVIPQLIPLITQGIDLYVNLTNHSLAGTAALTHQKVVDAIREHDSDKAYHAMLEHMLENKHNLEQLAEKESDKAVGR